MQSSDQLYDVGSQFKGATDYYEIPGNFYSIIHPKTIGQRPVCVNYIDTIMTIEATIQAIRMQKIYSEDYRSLNRDFSIVAFRDKDKITVKYMKSLTESTSYSSI